MGFTLLLDMFLFGLNMIDGAELNHNIKRTSKREQLCLSLIEEALETSGIVRRQATRARKGRRKIEGERGARWRRRGWLCFAGRTRRYVQR